MSGQFAVTRALVAANVRRLRHQRGVSLDELAAAGTATSSVSELENGNSNPTLATLVAVAQGLDVTVGDLLRA